MGATSEMKAYILFLAFSFTVAEEVSYDYDQAPIIQTKVAAESVGVAKVNRIVERYKKWIDMYAQDYKKTFKLSRAVERLRKYFTWWIKGNKKGCEPGGVDRIEMEYLDAEMNRVLPDNAMLKVYSYQTQMKRIQALFFEGCNMKVNAKLRHVLIGRFKQK